MDTLYAEHLALKHAVAYATLARELAVRVCLENDFLRDAVIVVELQGGLANARTAWGASPWPGRRIVRLLYDMADVEPLRRLPSDQRLARLQHLAQCGPVLRARLRYTRERSHGSL